MSREAVRCGDCHHLWTVTESYVWVGDQKCPIYLADAKHPVITEETSLLKTCHRTYP